MRCFRDDMEKTKETTSVFFPQVPKLLCLPVLHVFYEDF